MKACDDDCWCEPSLFSGSLYDLRDADDPPPRLAGMRSVSRAAAKALHQDAPKRTMRRPAGFLPR